MQGSVKNRKFPVKNVVLFALIFLTIAQIGELWFGSAVYRSSLFSFFKSNTAAANTDVTALKTPGRIITNIGADRFTIYYNDLYLRPQKSAADAAISKLLSRAEYVDTKPLDYRAVFGSKSIIYDYGCQIPLEVFAESFGGAKSAFGQRHQSFEFLVIIPGLTEFESTRFLFVDEIDGVYAEYTSNTGQNMAIEAAIASADADESAMAYFGSKLSAYDFADKNVFIPNWNGERYKTPALEVLNPYAENGNVLMSSVDKKIDMFFPNPASKLPSQAGSVYTYSSEYIVVKYYPDGILEYSNYRAPSTDTDDTFITAYLTALAFAARDTNIGNEYYLADYTFENDIWQLSFDYAIADLPVFSADRHAIEVSVSNGTVVEYSKITDVFAADEIRSTSAIKKIQEIENQLPAVTESGQLFVDIKLGYKSEEASKSATSADTYELYWQIILEKSTIYTFAMH